MFKNYFKTAYRNLIRNKKFSLINICGLAIGIASSILIFTVVQYELSYDTFQPEYNNIYQVAIEDKFPGGTSYTPGTPYPALDALRAKFPQIDHWCFIFQLWCPTNGGGSGWNTFKGKKIH